jgi:hypothetical protein
MITIYAEVKYKPTYVCYVCGQRAAGDTVRVQYSGPSDGLHAFMEYQQPRSAHMPVGWSFNGQFKHARCSTHIRLLCDPAYHPR